MTRLNEMRVVLLLALGTGCRYNTPYAPFDPKPDTDQQADADADADADSDADSDTDTDTQLPTDTDTNLPATCNNPQSLPGGYEQCDDGSVNKALDSGTCDATVNRAATCAGTETTLNCTTDSDCTQGANGKCGTATDPWTGTTRCECTYACSTAADCSAGQACLCAGLGLTSGSFGSPSWSSPSQCVPTNCDENADCASGECGVGNWYNGCAVDTQIVCRTTADTCRSDLDCGGGQAWDLHCGLDAWNGGTTMACSTIDCAAGRPFAVDGAYRTAPVRDGDGWSDVLPDLPRDAALAAWWARMGQMEHASVASFAQVSLQLMALGAPASLLAETQAAAADEVRHAQVCFSIASAFAGRRLEAGPLDLSGLQLDTSPRAVLFALIDEACVNETLSCAEAWDAAEQCSEPALKQMLTGIAADEQRHAELAWKTLGWMLQQWPALREEALARLATARADALGLGDGDFVHAPVFGVPGPGSRAAVRARAAETVLDPCIAALA